MNIDNNEQPEPTEEYPSHMVEETADEEEITDHQTVADILSEGQIYPEPITEERLREVVEEIVGENHQPSETVEHTVQDVRDAVSLADRGVTRIDVSQIPSGMTLNDAVEHYRTTGTMITDSATVVDTSYQGTTTDATDAQPISVRDPLDELFVNKEEMQKKEEPEKPNYTAEEIAEFRSDRKLVQKQRLQYIRKVTVVDMIFRNNDLLIPMNSRALNYICHHEMTGVRAISLTGSDRARSRLRRRVGGIFMNTLVFDKDGNNLIRDTKSSEQVNDRPLVEENQCPTSRNHVDETQSQFIIVDKRAYIESRGRIMKIKKRVNISMNRVLDMKKKWIDRFAKMDEFLAFTKDTIEQIMPKENFDIIFEIGGGNNNYNQFSLILKYDDVTIRNSIEMERHLGTMIVKSIGTLRFNRSSTGSLRSSMIGAIYGTRLTFTPVDAVLNYQHSHLTTSMNNFNGFCTGSESYRSEGESMDEFDIQSHVIKIGEFLKWESLEGGPHIKMETLHLYGPVQQIKNTNFLESREVGQSYVNVMVNEINKTEQKFTAFASAFTLINDKGNLKFVVDYTIFFKLFIELFGEKIVTLHKSMGERLYIYNSVENQFHKVSNSELTDPVKVLRTAKSHMGNFRPIYLNGDVLQSHLETEEIANLTDGVIFSPEPNFMKEVAQMILFKLTEKLEKDGNILKNKGEG